RRGRDPGVGPHRGGRDQAGLRQARVRGPGHGAQERGRPSLRGGCLARRGGGDHGHARRGDPPHDQPGPAGRGLRPGVRDRQRAQGGRRDRARQCPRLRRVQRRAGAQARKLRLGAGMTARVDASSLLTGTAERPALVFGGGYLSGAQLRRAAGTLATELEALGPRPELEGAPVAVVAPNAPAIVAAMLALWEVGAVPVPLGARLRGYELERILRDLDPAAIVSTASHGGY